MISRYVTASRINSEIDILKETSIIKHFSSAIIPLCVSIEGFF